MKKKPILAFLIFFLAASFAVLAQETEATTPEDPDKTGLNDYQPVEGSENWSYYYDLSGYGKGTYNLIIRGIDKSGNVYFAGPINIKIDPASDIPVVNISNPSPEMRVGGNTLNIVGICVDDDAVSYVEIQIDDGSFVRAEGSDYWSYYLDTTTLIDGTHTITVRGTDINGIQSEPVSRIFNLDTANPINTVTSHPNGVLVSGKTAIEGEVRDLNGVDELALSTDGGNEYEPVKLSYKKAEDSYNFKLSINSEKMEDGPHIYWLRSRDRTGSYGYSAFLFFVDNTAPAISILEPSPDAPVNGKTIICGKTTDEIGVTRLTWETGNQNGEIPLIPGNPYWFREFDFSALKSKSVDITFKAEDAAGNISSSKMKFTIDREADLPVLTVKSPENDALVTGELVLSGFAADDDGMKEISWEVDGGETSVRNTGSAFYLTVDGISAGKHKLAVRGTDINGISGNDTVIEFIKAGPEAEVSVNTLRMDGRETLFFPGIEVLRDKKPVFAGNISAEDGIKNASFRFGDNEYGNLQLKKGQDNTQNFEISAENLIKFGINTLDIKVTDIHERTTEFSTFIYVRNYTKINEGPGIYMSQTAGSSVRISADQPFGCIFIGDQIQKAELVPDTGIAQLKTEGSYLKVYPKTGGISSKTIIRVTTVYGEIFESGDLVFITDTDAPDLKISTPSGGGRYRSSVTVSGTASDASGIAAVEYSLDNGTSFSRLPLTEEGSQVRFSRDVSLSGMEDGGITLFVRAVDKSGNSSLKTFALIRGGTDAPTQTADSRESNLPSAVIMYPLNNALVSGSSLSVLGYSTAAGGMDSILYSLDKAEEKKIKTDGAFAVELDKLATGVHTLVFTPVDKNGAQGKKITLKFTLTGAAPSARLSKVTGQDLNRTWNPGVAVPDGPGGTAISGICGAGAVEGEYVFDAGPSGKTGIGKADGSDEKSFSIDMPSSLPYGRNGLTVRIKDAYGQETEIDTFFYKTAADDGGGIDDEEIIYLSGSGIKGNSIYFGSQTQITAYFNGRKIREASLEPSTEFLRLSHDDHYITVRPVGPGISAAVKIRVVAENGREFFSSPFIWHSDNKAPEINLASPLTGDWIGQNITVSGSANDDLGVKKLEYSLDGGATFKPLQFEETGGQIRFSASVNPGTADGYISMLLRAADETGNTAEKTINIIRDTEAAKAALITPLPGDTVNGKITVTGRAEDSGALDFVEFSDSGSDEEAVFRKVEGLGIFHFELDFSSYETLPESFVIQVHDKSGNVARFTPGFKVDTDIDKPVADIQIPADMAVLKSDFVISGMAFDDDGIKTIHYQLDDNPPGTLGGSSNFEIPVSLAGISDNEHTIKVWAEDLGGVIGDTAESTFIISKAEPVSRVLNPDIAVTVRGKIMLEGESSDENGIGKVFVSFDNANTYNLTAGKEKWSYALDTTVLADGTYSIYVKAVDNTETEGLSTTLLNIDNTPPEITLDLPVDGDITADNLILDGRAFDNIALKEIKAIITPLEDITGTAGSTEDGVSAEDAPEGVPSAGSIKGGSRVYNLPADGIFSLAAPLDGLEPGWYNLRLEAKDNADNMRYVSRNIRIQEKVSADTVDIVFPMEGAAMNGRFSLSGKVVSESEIEKVIIYLDEKPAGVASVNDYGYFKLDFGVGDLEEETAVSDGLHMLKAEAVLEDGVSLTSETRTIGYSRTGEYVTITDINVGDSVSGRPWLKGTAGYYLDEVDKSQGELYEAYKAELKENKVTRVEISLDNGRTFQKASGTENWKFRLETLEMHDGELPILVRAVCGSRSAVVKTILIIDNTPPEVNLLTTEEGQKVNEELLVLGTAQDENGLESVSINLRKGSKTGYSVPEFIQGMFIDAHFLGAADWETGIGLTFFDQVVKLQANLGHAAYMRAGSIIPERFYGVTAGVKILAGIAEIPVGGLLKNHDLDFLSMTIAVGASFNYFSMLPEGFGFYNPDEPAVIIGALLAQIE
ncbi:MAG: hypothetical protein JW874_09615, partial [Spirochaetales bacterium]|nr:hypothetical protein [Spirochaetales bacterium]